MGLKRQPTKMEVQRATTLFDKFTSARDTLNQVIKSSRSEDNTVDCYSDMKLDGFIWTTLLWGLDFVQKNLSIWSGFDMAANLYHALADDGWSIEDLFLI